MKTSIKQSDNFRQISAQVEWPFKIDQKGEKDRFLGPARAKNGHVMRKGSILVCFFHLYIYFRV